MKNKKLVRILVFVIVAVIFVVVSMLVLGKKPVEEKEERIPAVVVQKPVRTTLVESITISGYVEAEAMIPVVPFVSGTITKYEAQAGNYVEKDDILATIDDAVYRQQVLQAEAAYFAAKSTYDRIANLYKSGATTQQNYDSVKAQHDASKAQYDLAKLQLDYTVVKAPVSGTILIADAAEGGVGSQSQPLAIIADLDNQVVRLKVPEKYFDLFMMEKESLAVKIIRPAESGMYDDAVTTATIKNIAPYVSAQSKNFEVVCLLDEPGDRFRPGMYVKVNVAYRTHENVPVLPIQTKKMDGSCYRYNPETKTVKYMVPENIASDEESFVVAEEFADEFFVVDGQNFVFDGQIVKLQEEALAEY